MDQQIKDMICKHVDTEIDKIAKMPSLTDVTLNNLQKLVETKKGILKIEMLEKQLHGDMEGGYSNRYYGNSYGYMPDYTMDNSYRMGRSYDMGYSRDSVMTHLEAAMRDARNDQERDEIRNLMTRYHN